MTVEGPLVGMRIVELVGIGPGPYAGQLLAEMGAEVVAVERPSSWAPSIHDAGKTSVVLDLRRPGAAEAVLRLCEGADAIFEAMRPGVAERLGVGPEACRARNPAIVYGRMTGWGQTGPLARRAGHDLNYIALTGALHAIGPADAPPPPPVNFVGDLGGGSLFLVAGLLAGMLQAKATGQGTVVDAAIVDGANSMAGMLHGLASLGAWDERRGSHLIDGGAPFYRCYACADGNHVAVGSIEPRFFAALLEGLGIDPDAFGEQNDRSAWPAQHARLEVVFASEDRDHWATLFAETDACVTPVLSYAEAASHPHNLARGALREADGRIEPHPAPRFAARTAPLPDRPAKGEHTAAVLEGIGYTAAEIEALTA